ncbi:MAG: hypothetical protein IT328_23840 [Caldilineaceae bacterium]|nr:hypothetical protein [Caldilineaceae bacterium]
MPFKIKFTYMPSGYALESTREGELGKFVVREFTSSEDGELFINRLEGIPSEIISLLPNDAKVMASGIDHLVAVMYRDGTATVYVNELPVVVRMRIKRGIKAGEAIFKDDIVDIEAAEFSGLVVPDDAGLVVVFSEGWRKALFFDFTPLHKPYPKREYPLWDLLGQYYSYLSFQHLFKITDSEWTTLLTQQWFPFITLRHRTIEKMLSYVRSGWSLDDLLEIISNEVHEALDYMLERWANNNVLALHMAFLELAVDHYRKGDYISSTTLLYTRIEGIMRTLNEQSVIPLKATQRNLASAPFDAYQGMLNDKVDRNSLLLPHKFREYVEQVYFAAFTPGQPAPLSRNSIGHGVAVPQDFSLKAATIGLLIVDQIFFHVPPSTTP